MEQQTKQRVQAAGVTFAVSDVQRATSTLAVVPYADALATVLGHESAVALEAYSRNTKPLISPTLATKKKAMAHPFIHACNLAYDDHRPLVLSPDMIWLLIAQGVALHINANSEALRGRLVNHEGTANIRVRRDEFVRGFAGNDWEGAFTEFSEQIKTHVGDTTHGLIVRQFSTTGFVEQAAFQVTLMDALSTYYNYMMSTQCGIPEITLEGTPEDWESIREGVIALANYDLEWWTVHLLPVLDQFVAASRGDVDLFFWRSFYKLSGQSGGPYITGHVLNLFPYRASAQPSADLIQWEMNFYKERYGPALDRLSPAEKKAWVNKIYGGPRKPSRNQYLGWQELEPEPTPDEASLRRRRDREIDHSTEGMTSSGLPPAQSVVPFTWEYLNTDMPMEFVAGFVGVAQDTDTLALRPEIGWGVRVRSNEA